MKKNLKAPISDEITNEMLQYGAIELEKTLSVLFRKKISDRKVPEEWKGSITIPAYKKGNKNQLTNYRAITLLNSVSTLFTKIITARITTKITISKEQQ